MNVREVFVPVSHPAHVAYRPDIDGLRGIAVLAVIGFHYFPWRVSGGFVGVDVFFVISGYLITSILLRSLQDEKFSLSEFYSRRIRRLFPALVVVLAASWALGWAILLPTDFAQLGEQIVAGALFVANFLFWSEAGYFDVSPEEKPLLHLWSLSIEEQFYIVWPLLLWFVWQRKLPVFWTIAAVALVSFATNILITARDEIAAFYFPISRAWELGLGGLLASWQLPARGTITDKYPSLRNRGLSMIGLLMIGGSVFLLDSTLSFPGWWAALPVLGTCLVIIAGPGSFLNRQVLAYPTLVWVGLISYPLYLWHWVLLSFAQSAAALDLTSNLTALYRIGLILLSVALAELTYRFVEKPIRFGGGVSRVKIAALTASLAVVAVIGGENWRNGGFAMRYPVNAQELLTYDYSHRTDARMECWLTTKAGAKDLSEACFPKSSKKERVLVWGDSYAARLHTGLERVHGKDFDIGTASRNACPPTLTIGANTICRETNEHLMSMIRQRPPDIVILSADWHNYSKRINVQKLLEEVTEALADAGVNRVIIAGPKPKWEGYLRKVLHKHAAGGAVPRRLNADLVQDVFDLEKRLSRHPWKDPVEYFSQIDALCNDDGCLTVVPGSLTRLTSYNDAHLTTEAAAIVARTLDLKGGPDE